MPRSSGGGSHSGGYSSSSGSSRSYSSGGGSHSGGYSSSSGSSRSYSSGGGSHSGGHSSSGYSSSYSSAKKQKQPREKPSARVSGSAFRGAKKYVYYKDSQPRYLYSDYETFTERKHRRLLFWIPFILIFAVGLFTAVQPTALSMDYDTDIYISDTLGLIEDTDSLFDAMEAFRDTTGITPFIVTISNDSWNQTYDNLYSLAFDVYVNQFEDEKHWLLVYSEPDSPDPAFNDWCWEGVQGDDTVDILTEQAADAFGIALQKYLTNSKYSVGEAFTMAFQEITPVIMSKAPIDGYEVFAALLLMALVIWIGIKRTQIFTKAPERPKSLPAQATAVKHFAREIACEYCGGVYLSDSFNCPHCGAGRQIIH